MNLTTVCSGTHHSLACDDVGRVFAWGKGDDGQIGAPFAPRGRGGERRWQGGAGGAGLGGEAQQQSFVVATSPVWVESLWSGSYGRRHRSASQLSTAPEGLGTCVGRLQQLR
jgi:hypothetical protein